MSAITDYLTIALPVFGATVLTIGSCLCCAWRRIDRRLNHFEEILAAERQPVRVQLQTPQAYYPPSYTPSPSNTYPSAPPPAFYTPNNLNPNQ
jgi:hypothetical protein